MFIEHRRTTCRPPTSRVNFLEPTGKCFLYATAMVERFDENICVAIVNVESGGTVYSTGAGVFQLSVG